MMSCYEVFDADDVQFETRRRVTQLTGLFLAAVALTVGIVLAGYGSGWPKPLIGGSIFTIWLGVVWWIAHRMRQLRRVKWCIKLSGRRVVGYDYARRKTRLGWGQVERVELTSRGLIIAGPRPCLLEIPASFPAFTTLSHRVVHYAEAHQIPLYIDGRFFDELNVYDLFPFLTAPDDTPSRGAPGTPHGSATA